MWKENERVVRPEALRVQCIESLRDDESLTWGSIGNELEDI